MSITKKMDFTFIHFSFKENLWINKLLFGTGTARAFLNRLGLNSHDMVLVGDTLHDREVAQTLGIDYLLVAAGHQSKSRLLEKTDKVVNTLSEAAENL